MEPGAAADGPEVLVVPTGAANLASVRAGLARAGARPRVCEVASEVRDARYVVLPGVGDFGAAMETLRAQGLVATLRERVQRGAPTLAVCLGLQLLGTASEERPGAAGLAALPMRARRLRAARPLPLPQMGWNRVAPDAGCALVEPGFAYFANGFCVEQPPPGWSAARSEYGAPFVAALERGAVLACQFHPELSGPWGLELIRRWLRKGAEA